MQRRVIVLEGELRGNIGVVESSGHGYYCVRARGVQVRLRRGGFEEVSVSTAAEALAALMWADDDPGESPSPSPEVMEVPPESGDDELERDDLEPVSGATQTRIERFPLGTREPQTGIPEVLPA